MDLLDDPAPGSNTPEFTVSEIAGSVKKLVESELGWVRIKGEVGRVVQARSGHLYFDLKDDRSVLSCMTWNCLLYTSPSPRDQRGSRMPSSA